MGIAIGCFVLLFYAVTIAKLGPRVLNRPLCAPRLENRAMSPLRSPPTPTGADVAVEACAPSLAMPGLS